MRFSIGDAKEALKQKLLMRLLGDHVSAIVVTLADGSLSFAVDPEDVGVGGELRGKGTYALDELTRVLDRVDQTSSVLVVGAHVGTLAIPVSLRCRELIAIEANPNTYRLLSWNIQINKATRCTAMAMAASDKEEEIKFLLSTANSGGSKRTPIAREDRYYYDNPREILVKAYALDDKLAGRTFDTIIMDIEGSEFFALRGMQRILDASRHLFIEFIPNHLRDVSGATVEEFVSLISPHFSRMLLPRHGGEFERSQFAAALRSLCDRGLYEPSVIFEKD